MDGFRYLLAYCNIRDLRSIWSWYTGQQGKNMNLIRYMLNSTPILLSTYMMERLDWRTNEQFKFETLWLEHEGCDEVIRRV